MEETVMISGRKRAIEALALGATLGLVLTACSGGPGASQSASTGSPATDTSAAPSTAGPASPAAAAGREAVCEAAASEAPLEAWLNFGNYEPIVEDFTGAYPEIEVEAIQISPEDAVPRIVTEA